MRSRCMLRVQKTSIYLRYTEGSAFQFLWNRVILRKPANDKRAYLSGQREPRGIFLIPDYASIITQPDGDIYLSMLERSPSMIKKVKEWDSHFTLSVHPCCVAVGSHAGKSLEMVAGSHFPNKNTNHVSPSANTV